MPRARRSTIPRPTPPKGRAPKSSFPFPAPRAWPREVCERLRNIKGDAAHWNDIVIFDCGDEGAVYLEDALTAVQIVAADPAGWHVECGFPWLSFHPSLIDEYRELLSAHGYSVRIIEVTEWDHERKVPKKRVLPPAKVVNIAMARQALRSGGAQ